MKTKVGDYVRVCWDSNALTNAFISPTRNRVVRINGNSTIVIDTPFGHAGPFRSWVRVKSSTREGGK